MHWHYTPYILPTFVTAALSALIAVYVWRRRPLSGALPAAILMMSASAWTFGYALELAGADVPTKLFWAKVQYPGIVTVPVLWFIFALNYSYRARWISRPNLIVLFIIPVMTLLLVWTNEDHHLIWRQTRLAVTGDYLGLDLTYGTWFWIHLTYSYLMFLLGSVLILPAFFHRVHIYRRQVGFILLGATAPFIGNILYLFDLNPFPQLDLTPFLFVISGLAAIFGLLRFRLFDIMPVTSRAVVDNLNDLIIVLDSEKRIVDFNPAAQRIMTISPPAVIGQPAAQVLRTEIDLLEYCCPDEATRLEISFWQNDERYDYDLHSSPLKNRRGHPIGWLMVLHDITERKRAEEELARRARQLAALNDIARDMTGLLELDELCTTVCQQLHLRFGYYCVSVLIVDPTASELILRAIVCDIELKLEPGKFRMSIGKGIIGRAAETGSFLLVNDTHRNPDFIPPEGLDIRSELAIPLQADQRILGVLNVDSLQLGAFDDSDVAVLTTVTDQLALALEKARLYDEARRRAEQLETLYQVSRDLTTLHDLDSLLYQIAKRAIQLLNADKGGIYLYRPEQRLLEWVVAIGENIWQRGVTLKRGEGLSGRIWDTGQPLIVENYRTWSGKSPKWIDLDDMIVLGVPIQWGADFLGVLNIGATTGLRKFGDEDVALLAQFATQAAIAIENARLYQTTRSQAQQLQQILDTVQDGIVLLDLEHRVSLANPAAQTYLELLAGVGPGDILTHLADAPLAEILSPPDDEPWHEIALAEFPQRVFEVAAQPFGIDPDGKGWVILLRDVTKERETGERVRQQERLVAVGQLAAGIAHDFNNILTGIVGFAELTRVDPNISNRARQDMDRILEQSERASRLVRQILDFSRKSIIEKRPLTLSPFLYEILNLWKRTIPENIDLIVDIEPDDERYVLTADPAQIQQALTNLVINARDAMPDGGILQIGLSRIEPGAAGHLPHLDLQSGDWVVLTVSDTGVGISPDHRPHIFEPFYTTKEVGQGSGLGLAQVYGIVKQHEGEIEVVSHLGRGTTFTLYLPASAASLPADEVAQEPTSMMPPGRGETILLVEDEPVVLNVVAAMLKQLGYQVLTATNGDEGLEVYDQHADKIAVVLTDMTMPQRGGLSLSLALHQRNPAIKIMVLTGYPLESQAKELLARGIIDWLQKPISIRKLAQALRQALEA
jgi:PAS domain S-box-containing protein